jgi:hypothetical protein
MKNTFAVCFADVQKLEVVPDLLDDTRPCGFSHKKWCVVRVSFS